MLKAIQTTTIQSHTNESIRKSMRHVRTHTHTHIHAVDDLIWKARFNYLFPNVIWLKRWKNMLSFVSEFLWNIQSINCQFIKTSNSNTLSDTSILAHFSHVLKTMRCIFVLGRDDTACLFLRTDSIHLCGIWTGYITAYMYHKHRCQMQFCIDESIGRELFNMLIWYVWVCACMHTNAILMKHAFVCNKPLSLLLYARIHEGVVFVHTMPRGCRTNYYESPLLLFICFLNSNVLRPFTLRNPSVSCSFHSNNKNSHTQTRTIFMQNKAQENDDPFTIFFWDSRHTICIPVAPWNKNEDVHRICPDRIRSHYRDINAIA